MASPAAQLPADDGIDADLGEAYYQNSREAEEHWTNEIIATIKRALEKRYAEGRRPAVRDAHAFDNGCVKAIFRVDSDLRPDLQRGLFVAGHEYRAWIRFSNGNSEQKSRLIPDARGMAIKLIGVAGDKLIGDEKNTHDIILISNPAFFVDDLERYQATLEAFLRGGLWGPVRHRPGETQTPGNSARASRQRAVDFKSTVPSILVDDALSSWRHGSGENRCEIYGQAARREAPAICTPASDLPELGLFPEAGNERHACAQRVLF